MKNFWKPLQGDFKWNPNGILSVIGALGIIPAIFVGGYTDSFWCSAGFFILWYASEILQSVMKKKIIYFISFILVSCISGYFLCKHDNYVYTLLYILSIMLASYLLYKAFPINYKKEENDNDEQK